MSDLNMMVTIGGREPPFEEFTAPFSAPGVALRRAIKTRSHHRIVETTLADRAV
jgi:hypothetical protein